MLRMGSWIFLNLVDIEVNEWRMNRLESAKARTYIV